VLSRAPATARRSAASRCRRRRLVRRAPSGTEDIYKIYGESFRGAEHLERILAEAQTIVDAAITPAP
jgi:phosphoglucomutase